MISGKNVLIKISNIRLPFDEKVKVQCYSCKRYGKRGSCPPHIVFDKRIIYRNGIIVYRKFKVSDIKDWRRLSIESSLMMHKILIRLRNRLIKKGHFFITVFGAGSCKLCKRCTFLCKFPSKRIIPVEAMGINIVKLMKKYTGICLRFPVRKYFYRVGLVLYD